MKAREIIISVIFFLINPLFSIVLMLIKGLTINEIYRGRRKEEFLIIFGLFCTIFVSLINMQKVPEVDLEWYVLSYSYASKLDVISFAAIGSSPNLNVSYREPLFGILVWILNRLFNGNESLYKFSISLIQYSLMVASIIYWGVKSGFKTIIIMMGIVLICFYPYIFTSKMNIIRQSIANSLFLFLEVRLFFYTHKKWFRIEWLGIIAMPLIHMSSAFFLPLLLIPGFEKPFKKSWFLFILMLLPIVAYSLFLPYISDSILDASNGEEVSEASMERVSRGALGDYSLPLYNIIMCFILLLFSSIIYIRNLISLVKGMRRFLAVFIILSVFVLINMHNQLGTRFCHYILSLMPFLIMLFCHYIKARRSMLFALSLVVIIVFSIYLHYGFWTYDVIMGGWMTPVWGYVF